MEIVNELYDYKANILEGNGQSSESKKVYTETVKTLVILLSPFAPHVCDELWEMIF